MESFFTLSFFTWFVCIVAILWSSVLMYRVNYVGDCLAVVILFSLVLLGIHAFQSEAPLRAALTAILKNVTLNYILPYIGIGLVYSAIRVYLTSVNYASRIGKDWEEYQATETYSEYVRKNQNIYILQDIARKLRLRLRLPIFQLNVINQGELQVSINYSSLKNEYLALSFFWIPDMVRLAFDDVWVWIRKVVVDVLAGFIRSTARKMFPASVKVE